MRIALKLAGLAALSLLALSCNDVPEIVFIEGERGSDGTAVHTIKILNASELGPGSVIWYAFNPEGIRCAPGSEVLVEEYQGLLHRISGFKGGARTVTARYVGGPLPRHRWAPEGFSLVKDGKTIPLKVSYEFLPLPDDGEHWYAVNEKRVHGEVLPSDIIPALKMRSCPGERPEGWYRIIVGDDIQVESEDEDGAFYAGVTLDQLKANYGGEGIPAGIIEDWPDTRYRAYMLDVSRNFTTKENVKAFIDLLSRYKVNYLHLHMADDEAWRLEVPAIPELTTVGAHHSLDGKFIQPSYDGNADPESDALSNGFYSEQDFIDLLRYAWSKRVRVICEFDTPGHSRAAVYAMKAYEERTGDSSMRIQDPGDKSVYYTAQGYTDNVINVEMPSVYKFLSLVFDHVIDLYERAGVPLPAIHIGGDEVPEGAWNGEDRFDYYLEKVATLALEKGVRLAGWQEIVLHALKNPRLHSVLSRVTFAVNCWDVSRINDRMPVDFAEAGYPAVYTNSDYAYADQAYSPNKEERAHSWSGYIPATKSFNLPVSDHPGIFGVSAALFSETIRDFSDVYYNSLPKMLGVFEKGWNISSDWTEDKFFDVIAAHEMPYWQSRGIAFHLPQPGIRIIDGEVVTNSPIPGAEVRVSDRPGGKKGARTVYCGQESVTSTISY